MVIVPEYFFQKYPGMMGATKVVRMVIVPEYLFFPERIFAPDRSDYSETRKERIKGLLPVHPIMRERWMTHTLTNSCSYMTHSVRGERMAMMKKTNSYSYMIHGEGERLHVATYLNFLNLMAVVAMMMVMMMVMMMMLMMATILMLGMMIIVVME